MKQSSKKTIIVSAVLMIVLLLAGYAFANHMYNKLHTERQIIANGVLNQEERPLSAEEEAEKEKKANQELIFLILGTDKSGYRTDSMMLVFYDTKTKTPSLFSVPRDYKVTLSEEVQKMIKHNSPIVKLTDLHSYAKMADLESPSSLTTQAIEELLDIEVDHMVLFKTNAFRSVVDAVGGVELYVPQNMDYDDPTQDLHIHLKEGLQVLDGDKAEQFVRYRQNNSYQGYGDFGRMQIQQYFLKEFLKTLFQFDTLTRFGSVFEAISDFITTDVTFQEALGLYSVVKHADLDRLSSHTLPGSNARINNIYYYDPPEKEVLSQYILDNLRTDRAIADSSIGYDISILNGNGTRGLAEVYANALTENGYKISEIGDHKYDRTMKTQIIVPAEGVGLDLKAYFKLSEVVVDPEQVTDQQIIIILGRVEQ